MYVFPALEPGAPRDVQGLEKGQPRSEGMGRSHCPTRPLTRKPAVGTASPVPPSAYASVQGAGVPLSLVERGPDPYPKVCRSFRAEMMFTIVSCLCRAVSWLHLTS